MFAVFSNALIDTLSCSQLIANQCNNIRAVRVICQMFLPSLRKITLKKEDACAVIQAMTEVDVEEWNEFLLVKFFTMFCNVLIITGYNKKQ